MSEESTAPAEAPGVLPIADERFYVLVGDGVTVFRDRERAVTYLQRALQRTPEAQVAEVRYDGTGDQPTFEIEAIDWHEVALALADAPDTAPDDAPDAPAADPSTDEAAKDTGEPADRSDAGRSDPTTSAPSRRDDP